MNIRIYFETAEIVTWFDDEADRLTETFVQVSDADYDRALWRALRLVPWFALPEQSIFED